MKKLLSKGILSFHAVFIVDMSFAVLVFGQNWSVWDQ